MAPAAAEEEERGSTSREGGGLQPCRQAKVDREGRGGGGRGVSGTVASLVSCLSRTPRPRRGLKALWARGSQYFPGAVCSDSAVPACYSARLGAASWFRR